MPTTVREPHIGADRVPHSVEKAILEEKMKELRCREVGFDCQGVIRAETEENVLRQAADHARTEHGLKNLDEPTVQKVRSKIRTVAS